MNHEKSNWSESSALAKALGTVMTRRVGSVLVVSDGISFRQFDFGVTQLRASSLGPRRCISIVEAIRELKLITPEELAGLEHFAGAEEHRVADLALKHGFMTQEQYAEALRYQLTETLLDVYVWRGAEVRLLCQDPPADLMAEGFVPGRLEVPVYSFLSRTRVRVEEFRDDSGRLPTGREVYDWDQGAKVPDDLDLAPWKRLLARLDGSRTIERAIDESRCRWAPSYRFIQRAISDGIIRRTPARKAREVSRSQLEAEINELEEVLPRSPAPATVRLRLARAYETVGAPMPAAEQWKLLGRYWRRRGAHDQALEYYRNCVRLTPNDLAAREVIVEIHRATGNERELIAEGRPLAEMLFKYNLLKRATVLLMQLLEVQKSDIGLRRQLIQVLLGLGARTLALKHLKILAHELESHDAEPEVLRDVYLQVGALDHGDTRYRSRLDRLYGVHAQKRAIWFSAGTAAAVVLLAFTWFRFEFGARLDIQAAVDQARQQMTEFDFVRAKATLDRTLSSNGWSSASGSVADMYAKNQQHLKTLQRREQKRKKLENSNALRLQNAAREVARQAQDALEMGDVEAAHRACLVLFDGYPWSTAVADVQVPLRVTVIPSDARILLNGKEVGSGTAALTYTPGPETTLRIERSGFTPHEVRLERPVDPTLNLQLTRPELWRRRLAGPIDSAPLVENENIYVAGRDGRLSLLESIEGAELWSRSIGTYADVDARPVRTPSGLLLVTSDGRALHVNEATHDISWEWSVEAPGQPIGISGGRVVIPSGDGSFAALDHETGSVSWLVPPGTVASGVPGRMDDGRLVFVNQARTLAVADSADGTVKWLGAASLGLSGTPAADSSRVYALTESGRLRIIDSVSGALVGDVPLPHRPQWAPVAHESDVFLISSDGHVMAYDDTGATRFDPVKLPESASATPVVHSGRLYVPGSKGHLFVLDARTGRLLWTHDAGSRITAPPVFGYQTAYVVTDAGDLIAMAN